MGLKLTLEAKNNPMGFTFEDAYWHIEGLKYEMGTDALFISFSLNCYPTRESSKLTNKDVEPLSFGMPERSKFGGKLYNFSFMDYASRIFPDGVPMDRDSQLSQIYSFIKEYTGLPFEDVFEEKEEAAEPIVEPVVEPEPEVVEEPVVDEPISEVIEPDTVQTEEIEPHYFAESEETEGQSEEPEEVTEETETETEPEAEPEPEPEVYHNPLQL